MKHHTNKWLRQHKFETPTGMGYKKMCKGVKKVRCNPMLNCLILLQFFCLLLNNKTTNAVSSR